MQNTKLLINKANKLGWNILIMVLLLLNLSTLKANKTALEKYEPQYLVDVPIAGMLENLSYSVNSQLIGNGGFLFDFTAAFFKFMNLSISYGGAGVIGHQTMNMQKYPGVHLKIRIFEDENATPSVALGFNTQGKGNWYYLDENNKRHQQLAPDFYIVTSKGFEWALGVFSLNAGVNYSLQYSADKGINVFGGFEHTVWKYCAIAMEFNPNLNDKNEFFWKNGKSFMINGGLKVAPTNNMIIEIQFKDILRNGKDINEVGRYFGVSFISSFL